MRASLSPYAGPWLEEVHGLAEQIDDIQHTASILALEDRHTSGAYPKRPLAIVRGRGAEVWDAEGRVYLDLTSGQGVALLGHSHPAVVEAIARQAGRLITCPEIFYNDWRAAMYDALAAHTPPGLDRFFLCNSGAEAIEGALKLARRITGRPGFIAIRGGFHGRTLGALSATWNPKYREGFQPLVPGFSHIPFNDLAGAEAAIDGTTAAVVVEVIQGEGGVHLAEPEFLSGLRELTRARGALLILDEIQTGLGRTGAWFACQGYDVSPDILCLGKGIAGGLPMGVFAWREDLGRMPAGSHGSTFGGNPLACAASCATLATLEKEALPARADELGRTLLSDLRAIEHPSIRQVRGRGLMVGIELRRRATPVLKALMGLGVLALPAGPTVIRLLPPLVTSAEHLQRGCQALAQSLEAVEDDSD